MLAQVSDELRQQLLLVLGIEGRGTRQRPPDLMADLCPWSSFLAAIWSSSPSFPGQPPTSQLNSSISRRAPGSPEPEPVVGAVPIGERPLDVGDPRPGVAGHDAHARRGVVQQLDDQFARRRRSARCCGRSRTPPSRSWSAPCGRSRARMPARGRPCGPGTMSGSPWIGIRASLSLCCPRSINGRLSVAHSSHSSRCAGGVDLALSPTVAPGQREQHRTTPFGGRLDSRAGPAGTPPATGRGPGSAGRRPHRRSDPSSAPIDRVSCPDTSWASRVCRSRSDSRFSAVETALPLLLA